MAGASLFLPFLPMLPKQILLINFLTDLPEITISGDQVDHTFVERPHRWDVGFIRRFMVVFGLVSTAFDLVTFAVLLKLFNASEELFQSTWFVVSLLTELAVVLVLRTHLPCWRSRPSRLLLGSTIVVGLLAITLSYVAPVAEAFSFVPLPLPLMFASLLIVLLYVVATEAMKLWFYSRAGSLTRPRR
jgi:Mg2+-importing ATPase